MKAPIYNLKGEKTGDLVLPKAVFDTKVDDTLISTSIRTYLVNRRSSSAKVKDRGEVAGTTKKMWSQKGTGRARHGSAKVGIFVGGGSAHGPQGNQQFNLKLNQKTKKLALNSMLTKFAKESRILIIDDFKNLSAKTKDAWKLIDILEKDNQTLAGSKKIGIITAKTLINVVRAFRNISGFSLIPLKSLNILDLSKQNILIFSQEAIESFK